MPMVSGGFGASGGVEWVVHAARGKARASSKYLFIIILLNFMNVRVTGQPRFLHDFSIITALLMRNLMTVLDMTREHHSVIKMFCPGSPSGLFFLFALPFCIYKISYIHVLLWLKSKISA